MCSRPRTAMTDRPKSQAPSGPAYLGHPPPHTHHHHPPPHTDKKKPTTANLLYTLTGCMGPQLRYYFSPCKSKVHCHSGVVRYSGCPHSPSPRCLLVPVCDGKDSRPFLLKKNNKTYTHAHTHLCDTMVSVHH